MVGHGGCVGRLIGAGERRHLRLKHTGDDRYGPRADCRRHRLAAQAAQREGFEPPLPGHSHERSAQADDACPRGGEEPQRIEVHRPLRTGREGPEETKQLILRELQHCDRGASCAPNPFTRAYSTLTLLALTTLAQRSDSPRICSPSRSGAPPIRRSPASSRRALTRGLRMAALNAAFRRSITARGLPCGTMKPYQGSTTKPL